MSCGFLREPAALIPASPGGGREGERCKEVSQKDIKKAGFGPRINYP